MYEGVCCVLLLWLLSRQRQQRGKSLTIAPGRLSVRPSCDVHATPREAKCYAIECDDIRFED